MKDWVKYSSILPTVEGGTHLVGWPWSRLPFPKPQFPSGENKDSDPRSAYLTRGAVSVRRNEEQENIGEPDVGTLGETILRLAPGIW